MKPENVVVLYHGNCADGFGAAWAAYQLYGDKATYIAVNHGGDVPADLAGKDVLIVDFAYPRDVLLSIASTASSVQVLDHHVSNQKALEGIEFATFDMDRSGAGLTWDTLHPDKPRPKLIDYVEDRDLWNWKLPNSHEILMTFECIPFEFDVWTDVAKRMDTEEGLEAIRQQGRSLMRYKEAMIGRIEARASLVRVEAGGHCWEVPGVNASIFQSELGNILSEGWPFAVVWSRGHTGEIRNSFRSRDGGEDVSKVAGLFGGGGHMRAAGCTTQEPFEFVSKIPKGDN